ncbi:MAG: hypothetical protein K2Q09_11495 [Phycisphaerales bacterium]|nr:hypothetical protein [Phycisphaerales bacterium]
MWRDAVWPWRGGFGYRAYGGYGAFDAGDIGTMGVLAPLLTACGFLLLPVTMRRMRVRGVHLVRGVGHAAAVAVVGFVAWAAVTGVLNAVAISGPISTVDVGLLGPPDRLLWSALAVWLATGVWWWQFTRDYLKLPRAGWVAGLLFLVALLASVVACRPVQAGLAWVWDGLAWAWAGLRLRLGF